MIHEHYRGPVRKADALEWFNVRPPKKLANVLRLPAVPRTQAQRRATTG